MSEPDFDPDPDGEGDLAALFGSTDDDRSSARLARVGRLGVLAVRVCVAVLALFVLGVASMFWLVTRSLTSSVHTISVPGLHADAGRPALPGPSGPGTPITVLLLGSDERVGTDVGGGVQGQRADSIMLVRFGGDGRVTVLSIPRDSWVPIPGVGTEKINASLAGGPSLVVRTVEQLTGIGVDHVVLLHFEGVRELTTALGGVLVDNPVATTDPLTHRHFDAGPIRLSGDYALTYLRQRYGLPRGDFDRIGHQQEMLAAIARQLSGAHVWANPRLLDQVVGIVARNTTVDDGFTPELMASLLVDIASMPAGGAHFYVAPWTGFGRSAGGEDYVLLDTSKFAAVCSAIRDGRPVPLPATPIPGP